MPLPLVVLEVSGKIAIECESLGGGILYVPCPQVFGANDARRAVFAIEGSGMRIDRILASDEAGGFAIAGLGLGEAMHLAIGADGRARVAASRGARRG